MSKKRKIGAIIALDGEKEFKTAVTSCNKALSTMKSEMKLVTAETAGNANSLDTLKKKHEVLQKALDEQVKKEEAVEKGLEHAREDYERIGKELGEYKSKLEKAQTALKDMETSQDASSDAVKDQKETVAQLSAVVEKGEAAYQKAGNRVLEWEKNLNTAKAQTITATKALNENAGYMDEAKESTNNCAESIDRFGNKVTTVKGKLVDAGDVIRANFINTLVDAGKELAKSSFDSAIKGAVGLETAVSDLAASTGAGKEEMQQYSDVLQEMYKDNYGDSMDDLADALSKVKQYTNETNPDRIKSLAENALTLSDTFDIDISESLRAATTLMDEFGVSSDEAYDLMATGAQNGLNKSDELADNIAEYGSLWSQAGFSAEEMFAIMENGLDSGAYNLDKVNDFVKEFGVSLADGRIEDSLSSFSANTQDLFYQWKDGQASTKDVFQSVINDLASMTNQQEALTIASDTWSALGEDNSMKVITSLNNVNDAYEDVQGTMEEIKDIKYDTVQQDWEALGRTFQTEIAAPIAEDFLPIAKEGIEFVSDNLQTLIPIVAGIGTAFAADKIITGITGITTKLAASATATEGASTAMTIFNAVLNANPAMVIATAIGALTTAALIFSDNVDIAKTATQELADAAAEVNQEAMNAAGELDSATAEISSAMDGSSASANTAHRLVDELKDLESQSQLTSTEQSRMSTIVSELNTMFPDMALSIDEVSGSLSMGTDEIEDYVDEALNMAKVEAVQKAVTEATEKLVDAEIEQTRAQEQLDETTQAIEDIQNKRLEADQAVKDKQDELKAAQEAYNEALVTGAGNLDELYAATMDTSEAQIEYNGSLMTVSEAYQRMAEDEQALKTTQEEQLAVQETLNGSIQTAQSELDVCTQYLEANTSSTESNTDATTANTEAAQANADAQAAQTEAAQASIEVAGQELEAYNNLSESQQTLSTDVTNAVLTMQESVQSALESQMNMFEEFDAGTEVSTQTLLDNMQSQIDGVTNWEQQLAELAEKGIDTDLLQSLADMGPEGVAYVESFNSMTEEELAKANELWGQSVDIKNMTNEWGSELTQGVGELAAGGEDAWNELATSLNLSANDAGEYVVQGLVDGMQAVQSQAEDAAEELGEETIDSVNTGAGVASPSTKTRQSGRYVVEGLINGIKEKVSAAKSEARNLGITAADAIRSGLQSREGSVKSEASNIANGVISSFRNGLSSGRHEVSYAARNVADGAVDAIRNGASSYSAYNSGYNMAIGLGNGIYAGQSYVTRAAADVAQAAINQARATLDINSPSKVFAEIGKYSAMGLSVGFENETSNVERTIESSMENISHSALNSIDWSGSVEGGSGSGASASGGDITLQIPVYMNGVLTQTEVEKISLNALNKSQKKYNSARGVKTFAIA